MDAGVVVAIALAVAFAFTNGFHDAANAIAALVATGAATPFQAIVLACVFNLLGPLLLGAAVADTIGGIVTVAPSAANAVIGGGLVAAVAWNLATWSRGLPASSAQALVGGLVGAALAEGGVQAVNWGGFAHGRPVGVLGTLVSLAISPPLGALSALLVIRGLRRMARRATRRWAVPVRGGQWATAALLAFSHGANDAQKAVGVIAALLLANGRISTPLGADMGHRRVRGGADGRHRVGRLADHSHGGTRHLSLPDDRRLGIHRRLRRGDLRGVVARGADLHLSGGGVVGGRRRRRPVALAARALGGRRPHGRRLADHAAVHRMPRGRRVLALELADVRRGRWFLPETPDVLGLLRAQLAVTIDGVDAFAAWAGGDVRAAQAVRDAEQRGDSAERALVGALRAAFVTPLEPEDVFALSRGIDWILNYARNLISESEAMACPPDPVIADMATRLGEAVRHLDQALAHLGSDADAATAAADHAIETEQMLERVYYRGMAALLEEQSRSERIARRELYRRCLRIGEMVIDVSERVVYAVVKQS